MDTLLIEATEFSPKIYFNPNENKFEIRGESRPENTSKFYAQLIQWVEQWKTDLSANPPSKHFVFEFRFDYFNSTSAKFILDFLQKLNELVHLIPDLKISIRWYYDSRDEDMRESGEEFSHLVDLPFEFVTL